MNFDKVCGCNDNGCDVLQDHDASVFEFTIRYIGGLLGAFELSRDDRLLYKGNKEIN